MKRIAGIFMLLAGLSGCLSFPSQPTSGGKKMSEAGTQASSNQANSDLSVPMPSPTIWSPDPGHKLNGSLTDYRSVPTLTTTQTPFPTMPAPVTTPAPTPFLGASLVPVVTTPPKPALVAGNSNMATTEAPGVITSRGEQTEVHQASFSSPAEAPEPKTLPDKAEDTPPVSPGAPKAQIPLPPVPVVKNSSSEPEVEPSETPLVRMVNTKRITLKFEVKDVGPSGLASVELWYTKDGREWKKYDASTKSRSYVVEVDEEGMYGFTLLARSGIGLAKEAPAPGDQPQVWVIVDLTKPEVKLGEVTPTVNQKKQQVAIHWSASDKNLCRQPISLFYADKEQGMWKVMATNLENTGKYVWDVPNDAPGRFIVKVEAADLAGNVGSAQSPTPVLLDLGTPSVSIVGVEPNGSR